MSIGTGAGRTARDIIVKPIITEKSMDNTAMNKYTFKVAPGVNKIEIRKAVEEIFNVNVTNVNTVSVKGKKRRRGRYVGTTSPWKKAVVTLKEGQKIEAFEQ